MPTLFDFMDRATSGPLIAENDFNLNILIPNIRQTLRDHEIHYNPKDPLPSEDELADRLYEAAISFLVDCGIYCDATNRIIKFTREEILQAVDNLSEGSIFGDGKDQRLFKPRRPEDERSPWYHVGTGIVASSEEVALAQVEGYGSISQANSISIPAFNRVQGQQVISGSPLEIHATVTSVQAGRRALRNCGRPGLPIMNLISSATTAVGTIAGSHPTFGLRPSDGWLIDFLAEMKVNFETLNRLAVIQLIGGNVGSTALPILGGYAGGPEGTALLMTAYHLAGILLFQGAYHLTGPIHFSYGCSSTRNCLWTFSIVGRAISRNLRYPSIALGYAAAGPCTRMYYYEAAAVNLCCVNAGYGGIQTVHPAKAVVDDGVTPMEAKFNVETACAATAIETDQARELIHLLLDKYEDRIETAPVGKLYQECYDLMSRKPSEEMVRLYDEIKEELSQLGIPF